MVRKKVISASKKGRLAELEYAKVLEDRGFIVYVVPRSNKWTKNKDIFGCFDLIATSINEFVGVQVKCNSTGGAIKQLSGFVEHPREFRKMLAVRYDDGKWKEVWVK